MNKEELRIGQTVFVDASKNPCTIKELRENHARLDYIREDTGKPHCSLVEYDRITIADLGSKELPISEDEIDFRKQLLKVNDNCVYKPYKGEEMVTVKSAVIAFKECFKGLSLLPNRETPTEEKEAIKTRDRVCREMAIVNDINKALYKQITFLTQQLEGAKKDIEKREQLHQSQTKTHVDLQREILELREQIKTLTLTPNSNG